MLADLIWIWNWEIDWNLMVGFNQQWLNTDNRGKTKSKIRKLGSRASLSEWVTGFFLVQSRKSGKSSVKVGPNWRNLFGGFGVWERYKKGSHSFAWVDTLCNYQLGSTFGYAMKPTKLLPNRNEGRTKLSSNCIFWYSFFYKRKIKAWH